jgi:hypothetical protein
MHLRPPIRIDPLRRRQPREPRVRVREQVLGRVEFEDRTVFEEEDLGGASRFASEEESARADGELWEKKEQGLGRTRSKLTMLAGKENKGKKVGDAFSFGTRDEEEERD